MSLFSKFRQEQPRQYTEDEIAQARAFFLGQRATVHALQSYLNPPHEPLPELPGIEQAGRNVLERRGGVDVCKIWSLTFKDHEELLQRFDVELELGECTEMDIIRVAASQDIALRSLSQRLNEVGAHLL